MTTSTFIEWLKQEMESREWSQAELARKSKLSPAQITRLLNGERGIGENGLIAIANALKLPPDLVFEKAGVFPPKTELSPIKRHLPLSLHKQNQDELPLESCLNLHLRDQ